MRLDTVRRKAHARALPVLLYSFYPEAPKESHCQGQLCNDPPFLFADEPTGNLDDASSKVVEDIFDMLHREMKKTIILVTHDLDFAKKAVLFGH